MAEGGRGAKILKSIAWDWMILLILISPIVFLALIINPTGLSKAWVYFLPVFPLVAVLDIIKNVLVRR